MSDADPKPGEPTSLEPVESPGNLELENQKLNLEIRELQRPWWQKPGYLAIMLPGILSAVAVYVAYNRGYFDTQAAMLELKRERLQLDIEKFTGERDQLVKSNLVLAERNRSLESELSAAGVELAKKQDLLAMVPLDTHIERLRALTQMEKATIVDVQKVVNMALGAPTRLLNEEIIQATVQAIATELRKKDKYQAEKIRKMHELAHVSGQIRKSLLEGALCLARDGDGKEGKESSYRRCFPSLYCYRGCTQ